MCGRGEVHTEIWWKNLRERDNLKDLGVDGKIILKRIFKKSYGGMDWNKLDQFRDRFRFL